LCPSKPVLRLGFTEGDVIDGASLVMENNSGLSTGNHRLFHAISGFSPGREKKDGAGGFLETIGGLTVERMEGGFGAGRSEPSDNVNRGKGMVQSKSMGNRLRTNGTPTATAITLRDIALLI